MKPSIISYRLSFNQPDKMVIGGQYAQVAPDDAARSITLDETRNYQRRSLDESSEGSDIIYRDNLDVEPFQHVDEKADKRYEEERRMEDGEEGDVYVMESGRVGHGFTPVASPIADSSAAT